jgi:phosphoenolpyruvate carboxykinase (ATP)
MLFPEALSQICKGAKLEINPSFEKLRELSLNEHPQETIHGSLVYKTKLKGRSAKLTEIVEGEPTQEQKATIQKVAEYLQGKKLLQIDRKMCLTNPFHCRAYVSEAYAHIAYLWKTMLFDPEPNTEPDFNSIQIPEWPETKIIADPESKITFILGSDYTGELKKANLRLAMHQEKKKGGLGLHAGSKVLKVLTQEGKLEEKGVLLFGLSATGKTTLTCHHHWLDREKGEATIIRQDDVVLMQKDSYCRGTEDNFYIKTDALEPEDQPILYKAARSKNALLENVKVLENGEMDFFDSSITSNGRAVVLRSEMEDTDKDIDLPQTNMIIFLTRRDTIIPPVAKLSNEQAAAFFMLGESMGSAASDVSPGKPRRVVGTNPFIIGSKEEEGNRFYELISANPHLDCYFLNTGRVGRNDGPGEKITVHDSATIIKEIARGSVEWKQDHDWGYQILDSVPDVEISKFHPEKHYSKEQYAKLVEELKKERREWLSQFRELHPEIKDAI